MTVPSPSGAESGRDAAIAVALVVGGRAPVAGAADRLEAAQVLVEAQVEIDPLHLAVGDPVEPGADLVVDGQPDRVAHRLLAIHRAEQVGMRLHVGDELLVPARETTSSRSRWRESEGSLMASLPFAISA